MESVAAVAGGFPQFAVRITPWGLGAGTELGGQQISAISSGMARASNTAVMVLNHMASTASKINSYIRRAQEWEYQSNLAVGEMNQIVKQLRGAQIREAIAEREWKNHRQQMLHAEEIERFLTEEKNGKKTNQSFYAWMKREVKGLYAQ